MISLPTFIPISVIGWQILINFVAAAAALNSGKSGAIRATRFNSALGSIWRYM